MTFFRCRDAAFGYAGREIVRGINLEIDSGDYLCIVGENGSGKSTLLKGILRLLKPMNGTIFHCDAFYKSIGYVSQAEAVKKDFPAGVFEVVLAGNIGQMGLRPFYTRAEKEKAMFNMERLKITNLSKQCFRELSGGQQRRVLLARAMCASHELLILDEPIAGLDTDATKSFYDLLHTLNKPEIGAPITIVMVSHDIAMVEEYASKIVQLKGGRIC